MQLPFDLKKKNRFEITEIVNNTELENKKKYKILIVDDSQANIDYLTGILKNENYLIASSNNGATAITKAKGNKFDLILLDIVMEGMDGYQVCKELKKNPLTKEIPIIFLTGLSDTEHLTMGFECGAVDYVKKPFNQSELNARVHTHLELKKSKDLIAEKNKQLEASNEELERLSIVASQTSNSVIIANESGDIEWVNDGFTRLTGYTFEEYKNIKGSNMLSWSGNKQISDEINLCIKQKRSLVYSSVNITKDGKGRWIQTTLTPILNDNRKVVKLVAIDSDITYIKQAEQEIKKKNEELESEKNRSEALLLNILPHDTAEELKKFGKANVKYYELASVLFTDFEGFTKITESISHEKLVTELDNYFIKFDEIIEKYNLEKIKTIGDSYMCAGGIPVANLKNPFVMVLAGLEIQKVICELNLIKAKSKQLAWNLRLGIHTGELITGVVGKKKFAYDIWGDTVNTASRIESASEIGKVNISGSTYNIIKDFFDCTYRGKIKVKNKGEIDMYFVNRIRPEYSKNSEGTVANNKFFSYIEKLDQH
jgi:PAS domain S-box-containing protein